MALNRAKSLGACTIRIFQVVVERVSIRRPYDFRSEKTCLAFCWKCLIFLTFLCVDLPSQRCNDEKQKTPARIEQIRVELRWQASFGKKTQMNPAIVFYNAIMDSVGARCVLNTFPVGMEYCQICCLDARANRVSRACSGWIARMRAARSAPCEIPEIGISGIVRAKQCVIARNARMRIVRRAPCKTSEI